MNGSVSLMRRLSLSLSLSLSSALWRSLPPSRAGARRGLPSAHTQSLSLSLGLSPHVHRRSNKRSLSLSHTHSVSLSHTQCHSLALSNMFDLVRAPSPYSVDEQGRSSSLCCAPPCWWGGCTLDYLCSLQAASVSYTVSVSHSARRLIGRETARSLAARRARRCPAPLSWAILAPPLHSGAPS